MKPRSKYFLGLVILTSILFLFCCFSIIYMVLKLPGLPDDKRTTNYLSFAYLFLHLVVVAVMTFFALKSYLVKDLFLSVFMTTDHEQKNPKSYRNCLIFAGVFGVLGIFLFLNSFSILAVTSFFSLGLNLALTNVFLTVSSVALYMYFYKPAILEK